IVPDGPEAESDAEESVTSEEEVQSGPAVRPYSALLQSLQSDSRSQEPRSKRRKLQHQRAASPSPVRDAPVVEQNDTEEAAADQGDQDDLEDAPEDEDEDLSDPFEVHFAQPDGGAFSRRLKAAADNQWQSQRSQLDGLGKCNVSTLDAGGSSIRRAVSSPQQLKLKKRLADNVSSHMKEFTKLQQGLSPFVFDYHDVLFGARTVANAQDLRQLYCLHALNHIFKTRDRVIKNNARLAKEQDTEDVELRDQGFTRPKVLFLLETRQSCARVIEVMMQFCGPEQQENKKRFQDSFFQDEDKFSDDRPEDFRELFEGNDDNEFKVGVKFTRKTVKYFSPFYNSDIIFASPLGLRRAIEKGDKKKKDFDFLSSIEVLIMDQADAMLMQNWEHVEFVLSHLNQQPKDAHGCDFSRVRSWYLDGHASHLRQTIVLSAYIAPELNKLYNSNMRNIAGKIKIQPDYEGAMLEIGLQIKQTFSRFDSASPANDPDARFKYFTSAIAPSLARLPKPADGGQGVLIFIPSYLDFVRVRNYFANATEMQNISFGAASEYTELPDVRRARSHFMSGRHSVLLYTGRAHHFRRYHLKGVKKVIMYGLPENPIHYRELVGGYLGSSIAEGLADPTETSTRAMFSKWDGLKLERIVGSKRTATMLKDKSGDTFDFL
ncbi:DUF1253-domain-containing protein, partial [Saccharata proteae CBS 121410]